MMKESKKSLKWYFIVIGIFGLLGISKISISQETLISGVLQIIYVILGGIFVYIGVKIDELLAKSKFIINILFVNLGFTVINAVYAYSQGFFRNASAVSLIISISLTVYLLKSVKRLSAQPKTPEQE